MRNLRGGLLDSLQSGTVEKFIVGLTETQAMTLVFDWPLWARPDQFPPEALRTMRGRFAAGHGTYPLVGDPDTIAAEMEKITAAGFAGTTLSFVDYAKEFPFFRDEVLPRLERRGLRKPPPR